MNSATELGSIFIVSDVTDRTSVQIIDMGDIGPFKWETD